MRKSERKPEQRYQREWFKRKFQRQKVLKKRKEDNRISPERGRNRLQGSGKEGYRYHDLYDTLLGAGGKTSLEQLDGGEEIYDSYMVVRTAMEPARRMYRGKKGKRRLLPKKSLGNKAATGVMGNIWRRQMFIQGLAVLLSIFFLILLAALPVILIISVIYHSPFAILFPSVSQTDTIQQVLDGYVSEFETDIQKELEELTSYDESELYYENMQYQAVDDIYEDILSVYMVRYGFGVIAIDMTSEAREHLKLVFQYMCCYTVSEREEIAEADVSKSDTVRVKEVVVDLKGYEDMIPIYGFDAEEQAILRELIDSINSAGFPAI